MFIESINQRDMKERCVNIIKKILLTFFVCMGLAFAIAIVLAFTSIPFYAHFNLGKNPDGIEITEDFKPERVVMFGGAGMPSPDNLMRLYHTSMWANHFDVPVILVHPEDSICQSEMSRVLRNDGVYNIYFMMKGTNTRSQSLELKESYPELIDSPLLVVTSTEHVNRTIKCLKKVGFTNVIGMPAQEATVDFNLSLENQKLGGNRLPSVENTNIRYTFYNYLKLEIICMREYIALAYYRLKNWI